MQRTKNSAPKQGSFASMIQGRLISLAAGLGAWNMAADQALLESVDTSGIPVLRFYAWTEPTLSLGYFQHLAAREQHAFSRDMTCVRRSTGGGAILHDRELTYSISMPQAASSTVARMDMYRNVHQVIADALSDWNVRATPFRIDPRLPGAEDAFLCFQRRTDEDLVVSGYKVLGSAQRRVKHATLQHGSLLLHASSHAPELPGVCTLSAQSISTNELAKSITARLGRLLGVDWNESELSLEEKDSAESIVETRFGGENWLRRR